MDNSNYAFIWWLSLLVGIILIIVAFVKFKKYSVSLNCFFFSSLAFLIPMITEIIESFPSGLIIYGIILILILFIARNARVMMIIFNIYTLLQCLVLGFLPRGGI